MILSFRDMNFSLPLKMYPLLNLSLGAVQVLMVLGWTP